MKISFSTAVVGLLLPSFGSASPVSLPAAASSGLTKRRCGFETWDSTNLNNWFDAGTDAWFNQWWLYRLGGNGPDTTMVIPNNWPNNFVSPQAVNKLSGDSNLFRSTCLDACISMV